MQYFKKSLKIKQKFSFESHAERQHNADHEPWS